MQDDQARGPRRTTLAIGLGAGLAMFALVALMMNADRAMWLYYYRLVSQGQHTVGTVVGQDIANHSTCFFRYKVASKSYQGADQGCDTDIGGRVAVTYLPSDPTSATTASPLSELIVMVAIALFVGTLFGTAAAWRSSR